MIADKKIILIGGAPRTGKSFLAEQLSKKLTISRVATDQIRETMKKSESRGRYPALWEFDAGVEAYLNSHTPEQVFQSHHAEGVATWDGVKAWMDKNRNQESYIIEGVAVIPELVNREFGRNDSVRPIFLYDNDTNSILDMFRAYGFWDGAPKYSEDINKKYLEWVLIFNEWLKKECERYGYPLIEVGDRTTLLKRCLKLIK